MDQNGVRGDPSRGRVTGPYNEIMDKTPKPPVGDTNIYTKLHVRVS